MRTSLFILPLLAVIALFEACDQKTDGKVTPEMVTNSKTANGEQNIPVSQITFDQDTFNFGQVIEGEKVSHAFTFTNTGNNDLIISNAHGSCGCTVPEWPKEPIAPGKKGSVDVVFNSKDRPGAARKDVTVYANTEPTASKIVLIGTVKSTD